MAGGGGCSGAARTIPTEASAVRASATVRQTDTRACFHASSGNSRGGEILVARHSRGKGVRAADVRRRPTQRPVTEEGAQWILDGASSRQRLHFP